MLLVQDCKLATRGHRAWREVGALQMADSPVLLFLRLLP